MNCFFAALPTGMTLFALACVHATILVPYIVLVPGERTNLFTALALTLPALQLLLVKADMGLSWRNCIPWGILALGLGVSALASSDPQASAFRGLAFFLPAVSGIICGRVLLGPFASRVLALKLFTICFAALAGSHMIFGVRPSFMGLHHHALVGVLLLLSSGPIYFACNADRVWKTASVALLGLGLYVCFAAGSRFVVLLPFVLIPVYIGFKFIMIRSSLAALAVCGLLAVVFFYIFPEKVPHVVNYESVFYRVEAFPATLTIIKAHPLLGIGIRTSRIEALLSFTPSFSIVSKDQFMAVVGNNVTWDNQYLSLLCGIGIPFTLLYFILAGRLLTGYLGKVRRHEIDRASEKALTFALLASAIHFSVHDGLYYPQIDWLFHVLLGAGVFCAQGTVEKNVDQRNQSASLPDAAPISGEIANV